MSAYAELSNLWERDTSSETAVTFLLIQGGKVRSTAQNPIGLYPNGLDESYDWAIYVGHKNEFGKREIVAPIAMIEGLVRGVDVCRITSESDGNNRLVGVTHPMFPLVKLRLQASYRAGRFSDLCQLPQLLRICREVQ